MLFSSELINGTLQSIVLSLLKSHHRMCGYELAQQVKEYTDNCMQIKEGALYPVLYTLEAQGLITAETKSIGKRIRKYYSLSAKGSKNILKKGTKILGSIGALHFLLYSVAKYISTYFTIFSQIIFVFGRAPSGRAVRYKSSLFTTAPG